MSALRTTTFALLQCFNATGLCESAKDCPQRYFFCVNGHCARKACMFDKTCRIHNPTAGFKCRKTAALAGATNCQKSEREKYSTYLQPNGAFAGKVCDKAKPCPGADESCYKRQCWRRCNTIYDCLFDGFSALNYRCFESKCIHVNYVPRHYCDRTVLCPGGGGKEGGRRCVDFRCVAGNDTAADEPDSPEKKHHENTSGDEGPTDRKI